MDGGSDIELSDMISYVIGQIRVAHQEADEDYTLSLDDCTIEMNITVTKEGGAGIKAYVVTAGASISSERVHKVVARFRPYKAGDPTSTAMEAGNRQTGQRPAEQSGRESGAGDVERK
jgi:Trypsin-co-occurring domain 2